MKKDKASHRNTRLEQIKDIKEKFQETVGDWFGRVKEGAQETVSDILNQINSSKREGEIDKGSEKHSELPTKITPSMVEDFINEQGSFQGSNDTLNPADEILLSDRQKEELESLIRATTTSQNILSRAKIILGLVQGKSKYQIKNELGSAYTTINRWQRRWISLQGNLTLIEERGTAGSLKKAFQVILGDAERSGAPPTFTEEQVIQIIALACTPPQEVGVEVSHWSIRLLARSAADLGIVESISPSQVAVFFSSPILNRIGAHIGSIPKPVTVKPSMKR